MEIRFVCPQCGNKYRFDASHAGERMECSWCATAITIPHPTGSGIAHHETPAGGSAICLDEIRPGSGLGCSPKPGSALGSGMRPGSGIGKSAPPAAGSGIGVGPTPGGSGIGKYELIDDSSVERYPPAGPPPALDGSPVRQSSLLGASREQPGSVDPTEVVPRPIVAAPAPPSPAPRLRYPTAEQVAAAIPLPSPSPAHLPPLSAARQSAELAGLATVTVKETRGTEPVFANPSKTQHGAQTTKTQHSRGNSRPKKTTSTALVLAALGGGGVAALLGIVVVMAMSSPTTQPNPFKGAGGKIAGSSGVGSGRKKGGDMSTPQKSAKLVLQWPPADRSEAAVFIDGKKLKVPLTGPVEFPLTSGEHEVVVIRRGYDQIDAKFAVSAGGAHTITPQFARPVWLTSLTGLRESDTLRHGPEKEPEPTAPAKPPATVAKGGPFDAWEQDFEAAKKIAATQKKDILILFDGSDWCGYSIRMTETIFAKQDFLARAGENFVLVFIDFPRSPAAKAKVRDGARNHQMMERFGIEGYPTIVLADEAGRPYAYDGYQKGDVASFVARMKQWREVRAERDRLFAAVGSAQGESQLARAVEAVVLLNEIGLTGFYEPELTRWQTLADKLDPANKSGRAEVIFEAAWKVRATQMAGAGPQRMIQVIEELDGWSKSRQFQDADRAAKLYFAAAYWMMSLERLDDAKRYLDRAIAFRPPSAELGQLLVRARRSLDTASEGNVLATGSGFVVAEGGYILTNLHVVDGGQKLLVRFPEQAGSVPATLVAQDVEHDMALLQVDPTAAKGAKPIAIAGDQLGRGTSIGAFGYPLNDVVGDGLKLTTGIISATHRQTHHGLMLLDCRINPGNSGGPLCSNNGCVAGMVTAKSHGGADIESYGMAIPGEKILAFLKAKVPGYVAPPIASASTAAGWDEVDRKVSPSVVLILKGK
ncbi:MAG: trypsin-like peptidase domain-containing protein [Pirellulaceae bacterium]|nr:trypsin-like peptidase domain-containing protein [Pirellulaceae bacterium]